ncbi:MAG: hypothetical protein AAF525_17560 [Pseudomonadota bacterium]
MTVLNAGTFHVGTDTARTTLTVMGDIIDNGNQVFEFTVMSVADHDQLVVAGTFNPEGELDLEFLPGYVLSNTTTSTITVATATNVPGFTYTFTTTHDLAAGYDSTGTTSSTTVGVRIQPGFENVFTGAVNATMINPGNWTGGSPLSSEDVLIAGGLAAEMSSTYTGTSSIVDVRSLSLEEGATLDVLGAAFLTLGQNSRSEMGTTITLDSSGTATDPSITIDSQLIVDGDLDWAEGRLQGTGNLIINGDLNVTQIGVDQRLNLPLLNNGTINLDSPVAGTISSVGGSIANDGVFNLSGMPTLNLPLTNNAGGVMNVSTAGVDTHVTVGNGWTNNGMLALTSSGTNSATFEMASGTFTNNGTVQFAGTGAGVTFIGNNDDNIIHNGVFDVDSDGVIDLSGLTLDAVSGTFDVATGATLSVSVDFASVFELGGGTEFVGDGALLIDGAGSVIELQSDTVIDGAPGFVFDLGTSSTVTASFMYSLEIADGNTLIADNTQFATGVDIVNHGDFVLGGTGTFVEGNFLNDESGTTTLESGGTRRFAQGFENLGLIVLTRTTGLANILEVDQGTDTTTVGILTNRGTLQSVGVTGTSHVFRGELHNEGLLDVDYNMQLNEASAAIMHVNRGTIDVDGGAVLTLAGDDTLMNEDRAILTGNGTIASILPLENAGVIAPGTSPGQLSLISDLNMTHTAELQIEVDGLTAVLQHDVLSITGTLDLAGGLELSGSYNPTPGDMVTIVNATNIMGHFDWRVGLDVDTAVVWTIVQSATDITLSAVATTQVGTPNPDMITGTGARDVIVAGAGPDSIEMIAGDDIVFAQAGDDTVQVDDTTNPNLLVHGGSGIDQLRLTELTVDLTADSSYDSFEVVSVRNEAPGQTLMLDEVSIININDDTNGLMGADHGLVIVGDDGDTVEFSGSSSVFVSMNDVTLAAAGLTEHFSFAIDLVDGDLVFLAVDEHVELEITRPDTSLILLGGGGNDVLVGTGIDDQLIGRGDPDTLDGVGGNDLFLFRSGDTFIGGSEADTLLLDTDVDFTGLGAMIGGIEVFDMDNSTSETLTIGIADLLLMGGDDGLGTPPSFGIPGFETFVIDGDASDTVIFEGFDLNTLLTSTIIPGVSFSQTPMVYNGDNYHAFVDTTNMIELLVHEDMVTVDTP